MRRESEDRAFQPSEESVNFALSIPPAILDTKKFKLLRGHYLVLIYSPVLLFLLIFITVACFHYYSQDPVSYFSVPDVNSSAPRVAICLVGGARRFELTGPSILKHVLDVLPEADLFVHTNLDKNTFKLGLLKLAPHVAEVRIRRPLIIPETDEQRNMLLAGSAPNGLQGLLQYLDLVEGCLDMIGTHESQRNFTYDWILRTRLDGYWSGPLDSNAFKHGSYVVPVGSRYGGLNDRLGIGNRSSSQVALSRLSLLHQLASAGFHDQNSESSFRAQLTVHNISVEELRFPFCILTDRSVHYPPKVWDLPVASISSPGPLNGAYCRPCIPQCKGECVEAVSMEWDKNFNWIEWRNGTLELCNASQPWQEGWEEIFDKVAGNAAANVRRRYREMKMEECATELQELKGKTGRWNGPDPTEVCNVRLVQIQSKN